MSFSYLTGDISFSTDTLSLAATFTTVSVGFTTTGFPTFSTTSPVLSFTVYVVVVVLLPSFPLIVMFSCPFSREPSFSYLTGDGNFSTDTLSLAPFSLKTSLVVFSVISPVFGFTLYVVVSLTTLLPSLEYTILSLAATFTTVSVGSTTTGFPTFGTTSPVLSFTVYVVVVVLLPSFPLIVIFSWPFSREPSFSYLTSDGNFSVDTLSLAPFSLKTSLVVFSVISPVFEFTLYVVVSLITLLPSLEYTILSLAATFTTVSVGFTTAGFPTFGTTSPVLSFTVYVVVVVLLPSFPLIVMFSCPFSRELSFSYLIGEASFSVTTLSLAPSSEIVSLVEESVIPPLVEFTV